MLSFNHKIYVGLKRDSSKLAHKYKVDCGLITEDKKEEISIPVNLTKEVLDTNTSKEEKEPVTSEVNDVIDEKVEEIEFNRDDLKKKLDEAGVEYIKNNKTEKLLEKCIENNLL